MPESDLEAEIATASRAATLVREVTIGPPPFLPMYPYHRAVRVCPFCEQTYRIHGGFADHRDRCEEGPNPGSNPLVADGGVRDSDGAVGHCYWCGGETAEGGNIRVQVNEGDPKRETCPDCLREWPPEGVGDGD